MSSIVKGPASSMQGNDAESSQHIVTDEIPFEFLNYDDNYLQDSELARQLEEEEKQGGCPARG